MSIAEFLASYTFRMVLLGTTVIGVVAGALGCFAYLRKQSLISDVVSHSALPGTLGAFLVAVALDLDGRNLVTLTVGAVVAGTLAAVLTNYIRSHSKLPIDAAMVVVLTVFFGIGMVMMRIITNGRYKGKGGIQDYLFGNASHLTQADLITSLVVGGIALAIMLALFKEFSLRAFDSAHATVIGLKGKWLDLALFAAIVAATVIGVKAVGLVLMVAFVVMPPATARQWTNSLPSMVVLSAFLGGLGSAIGAYVSVSAGNVPTGPVIVVVLSVFFLFSLLAAPRRGLVARWIARNQLRRRRDDVAARPAAPIPAGAMAAAGERAEGKARL
ncbi:metal ABC transporter permease [Buchananella felis]|uniref:metal ABC transporter permease n=1 Tax=Buchananella felis TaxID=3231492 RepID=UPI0035296F8E